MGDGLRKIKSGEQACAGDLANYDNVNMLATLRWLALLMNRNRQ
jgi:hypothetical protein